MFTIPRPPWPRLGRKLESMTRKAIFDFNLLSNVDHLGVALSGGKDSLTLLFLLHAIIGRGVPLSQITALHIHGKNSCGASLMRPLLEKICSELGIPLIIKEIPTENEYSDCYSCSRERRKMLFSMALQEGISTIAFGHHRDDNAQTTLMNLFHKGEFAGMLPKIHMHAYKVTIIRPLIYIPEAHIASFALAYGFKRITCRCPLGQNSIRKKTSSLIEEIETLYPNASANISQAVLRSGNKKALKK
jgi:tRNA 2-thiocytidine biosynthesis protein TtcA